MEIAKSHNDTISYENYWALIFLKNQQYFGTKSPSFLQDTLTII